MKKKSGKRKRFNYFLIFFVVILFIVSLLIFFNYRPIVSKAPVEHPRLFFDSNDISSLRTRLQNPAFTSAVNALATSFGSDYPAPGTTKPITFDDFAFSESKWAKRAEELCFRAAVFDDATAATRARDGLFRIIDDFEPTDLDVNTLTRGFDYMTIPRTFSICYDLLFNRLTSSERTKIKSELEGWLSQFYIFLKSGSKQAYNNHFFGSYGSLGLGALALEGELSSSVFDNYLNSARNRLSQDTFGSTFKPGGQSCEGPGYASYGQPIYLFAEALYNAKGVDLIGQAGIKNVLDWQRYIWLTQGVQNQYRYAIYGDNVNSLFYTSAESLVTLRQHSDSFRAIMRHFWDQTHPNGIHKSSTNINLADIWGVLLWYPVDVAPVDPDSFEAYPESKVFDDYGVSNAKGGIISLGNGFGTDSVRMTLQGRYDQCNHQHYDMTSFTLDAYGKSLGARREYYAYDGSGYALSDQFNLIQVDNLILSKFQCCGTGGVSSFLTKVYGFVSSDRSDYVRIDGRYPYADLSLFGGADFRKITEAEVTPFNRAERIAVHIKDGVHPFYVMIDDFNKDGSQHSYQWRMHTDGTLSGTGDISNPVISDNGDVDLKIYMASPDNFQTSFLNFNGQLKSDKIVQFSKTAIDTIFVNVLYPVKTGFANPSISKTIQGNNVEVKIDWGQKKHIIVYSRGGQINMDGLESDARIASVSIDNNQVASFLMGEGTYVTYQGVNLFNSQSVTSVSLPVGASSCLDVDGDGYGAGCALGPDCRDDLFNVNPGAFEICDADDNDCDNLRNYFDACAYIHNTQAE